MKLRNSFKILVLIIINFCIWNLNLKAQDTARYCQENCVLFSNCYDFVRTSKGLNYGTFTERILTSDGQIFYGWGSFKESKSSIELTYSKINTYPLIKYKNAKVYSDTLIIQWYSRDNAQEFFKIRYMDSTIKIVYKSNYETALVKIPKEEIKDTRLELYQGSNKIVDFNINSSRTDFIIIYAEDPRSHYLHKRKEKLEKTKFGFMTQGVNTKEKKSNFVEVK